MKINKLINIGDRIKTLRLNKGLTQAQLADAIGIPRTTYANYETNKREPKIEVLNKIANQLGVTIDDILTKNFINKDDDNRLYLLSLKIFELVPLYSFEEIEEAIEITKKRIKAGEFIISEERMNKNEEIDTLIGLFSGKSYQVEISHILAIKTAYNLSGELYSKYFEQLVNDEIIDFLSNSLLTDHDIDNELIAWNCILDTLGFEYSYDIIENDLYYRKEYVSLLSIADNVKDMVYKEFSKLPK
ncbi:phage transcriptional regulator [Clostridium baratii]|uniref:helix-turn-helix domain-containing protein n=1 Tax=Clostridium baratii TaxID=1561 RepID=UPI0006C16CBE|nr:helix-turn-helix transcriptional regulator [Clostridium baratii]CUP65167.1 phage transcriptional regulator [Clostridium baratii]